MSLEQIQHGLGLKQYTKDIPPGWGPRMYPIVEYVELLKVWSKLTRLDEDQIPAAIMSRLVGKALRTAHRYSVSRLDALTNVLTTHKGIDALSLPAVTAITDRHGGVLQEAQPSGIAAFLKELQSQHALDEQDKSWMSLDRFFNFSHKQEDFISYQQEWHRLF